MSDLPSHHCCLFLLLYVVVLSIFVVALMRSSVGHRFYCERPCARRITSGGKHWVLRVARPVFVVNRRKASPEPDKSIINLCVSGGGYCGCTAILTGRCGWKEHGPEIRCNYNMLEGGLSPSSTRLGARCCALLWNT